MIDCEAEGEEELAEIVVVAAVVELSPSGLGASPVPVGTTSPPLAFDCWLVLDDAGTASVVVGGCEGDPDSAEGGAGALLAEVEAVAVEVGAESLRV